MRDNSQRAQIAIILIWIVLLMEVLVLISSLLQINLLQEIENGLIVSEDRANMNDLREGVIGLLYLAVYIISAITYIRWFRRAYFNLQTRVKNLSTTDGWAAGSWFVPIMNLYRPYQIMKELYERTHEILSKKAENYEPQLNYYIVGLWWAFWVISNIFTNIESRITLRASTVEDFIFSSQLGLAASALGIPLCFLAIKVIKDYARMETIFYRLPPEIGDKTTELDFNSDDNILDTFK